MPFYSLLSFLDLHCRHAASFHQAFIWPEPCRVLVKASTCFLLVWIKWIFKEQRFNFNKNKENFKWYILSNFFYFTRFILKKKVCCPRNTIMGPSVNAMYFHYHKRVGLTAALSTVKSEKLNRSRIDIDIHSMELMKPLIRT